jgi:hypothetical protein
MRISTNDRTVFLSPILCFARVHSLQMPILIPKHSRFFNIHVTRGGTSASRSSFWKIDDNVSSNVDQGLVDTAEELAFWSRMHTIHLSTIYVSLEMQPEAKMYNKY